MSRSIAKVSRRQLMGTSAALGTGYWLGGSVPEAKAANEKLNIALIGIGGRGAANLNGVARENIVALCDVDEMRAGSAFERWDKAKKFVDYRRMFDALEKQIDAVVVSTPDHTHFPASMMALRRGLHLYCEKPMAHNVWQVRMMTEAAEKYQVATQLGVQRHTIGNVHRVGELVRAGAIGTVREVHSWVGGTRGMPAMPKQFPAVPSHLDWDLWLGPTAARKYSPDYCPYNWRFWWDFGTGETGNWGCHILDIPFWALDLDFPTRVDAQGPQVDAQRTPRQMATTLQFPARSNRPSVTLHWYHSASGPEILREHKISARGANTVFVGSEGLLVCGFGSHQLYPQEKFQDLKRPERSIPDSPGFYKEWLQACRGGEPATCHFGYSGPLTETVLLANVAYRAGGFNWDAKTLTAAGNDRVAPLLREPIRAGWDV